MPRASSTKHGPLTTVPKGFKAKRGIEISNRYTATKNPNNPPGFNNFEISNRYKSGFSPIRFAMLPAVPLTVLLTVLMTTTRRRCYLPTARAIQYPAIHTGASKPA
jgi:hypothetical protein